jgi:hypothetical protein
MYYVVHETNKNYVPLIKKYGLFTSSVASARKWVGQGSVSQVLTNDPSYLLNHWTPGTLPKYTSVDAVYFRVVKNLDNLVPKYGGSALIVLNKDCLDFLPWHFNTTENFGFYLNNKSPFTDELGTTVFSFDKIKGDNTEEGELVVMSNVSPRCIKSVFTF